MFKIGNIIQIINDSDFEPMFRNNDIGIITNIYYLNDDWVEWYNITAFIPKQNKYMSFSDMEIKLLDY